jgi:rubrerythrin
MPEVKVWRCLICGDSYIGTERPSQCPFCGSHESNIVQSDCYPTDINDVEVTEAERADLLRGCELEIENATLYTLMGKKGEHNALLPSAYRAFAKVEREHLEVFGKLLKIDPPNAPKNPVALGETWNEDIALSDSQEHEARDFYQQAADRATTPRVRQVFLAISEVENDHIIVDSYLKTLA